MHFYAKIFVRTVLTDLLNTSCQKLYQLSTFAMNYNFNTIICTLHDFHSSKVRFIDTSTVTGSHSCSERTTRTPRVHLVLNTHHMPWFSGNAKFSLE